MTIPSTTPQLVESLADLTVEAFPGVFASALTRADLVELRLDRLPAGILDHVPPRDRSRVLATCRAAWEGGAWSGTDEARLHVLSRALDAGVAFIDVEWREAGRTRLLDSARHRVVLSVHDFEGVPDDLAARVAAMADERPAVVKVAVQAHRLTDVVRCRDAGRAAGAVPVVLIAMGMQGVASRILAGHLGSCWTYAGNGVAPGQIPASVMRDVYRVGRVTPDTAVYGVAGRPIGHSLSPILHNAAFEALGLNAVYVPFEALDADDLFEAAEVLGVRGLSVTAPFKEVVLQRSAHADAEARGIGAANTLVRTDDGWRASNTDVEGFLAPLRRVHPLRGVRVSVLGAGGAARAVVTGLVREGAVVTVHARRAEQVVALKALGAHSGPWPPAPDAWEVLINTTPVGTSPHVNDTPLAAEALGRGLVYDLVYNPADTRLLREARAAGASTLGGLEMLITQAAHQCARWFDVPPPIDVMRDAVARHAPHLVPPTESACRE